MSLELIFIFGAVLLVMSVVASKLSTRFGIPSLLLFLLLGMLAGSEGLGGIYFDNAALAQGIGVFTLMVVLYTGGLDASWQLMRTVVKPGLALATLGVLITAFVVGVFAYFVLGFSLLEGLLLGAIVSSTDAAAVFLLLPVTQIRLKGRLTPLLQFESGSNDPMAVFLTIGLIQLIQSPDLSPVALLLLFFKQMLIGGLVGWLGGKLLLYLINHARLGYEGLYPVLALGVLLLIFGATNYIQGSGFLAVYLVGLVMSRADFLHKRGLHRFFDSLAGLLQIVMFLTLGLLVFPSQLAPVAVPGLILAAVLILIARPLGVWASLMFSSFQWREKAFIAWVGLRGAVPIILATYPMLAGIGESVLIFNVVFFVVLSSVLIQGSLVRGVARLLCVEEKGEQSLVYPLEFNPMREWKGSLKELVVQDHSWAVGKAIYQLGLPAEYLVVLIARESEFLIPNGSVELQAGDRLLGLSETDGHEKVAQLLQRMGE